MYKITKILYDITILLLFQMVSYLLHNSHFWSQKINFFRGDSLQRFCNGIFEQSKVGLSALGTTTLCFKHNLEPLGHTTNQVLAHKGCNFPPFVLHPLSKSWCALKVPIVCLWSSLVVVSQVLNVIKVR